MAIIKREGRKSPYIVKERDANGRFFPQLSFRHMAEAKAYEKKCQYERMIGVATASTEVKSMLFKDYWLLWEKECRFNVSEGWKMSQNQAWRDYVLPYIGDHKLISITSRDINNVLIEAAKKLQPGSVLHIYNLLHKMFFNAVDHFEFIDKNPVKRKFRPFVQYKERSFLEPDQVWDLLFYARNHYLAPAIWIMALTGLRAGEVCALKWDSVDFERRQILIRSTWNKKIRKLQDYPKGKKWTRVPMPEPLLDLLKGYRDHRDQCEFVCQSIDSGFLQYEQLLYQLKKLCKQAEIPVITPHELRHSTAELYFNQSASIEDVRKLFNHQDATTTKLYVHRTDSRLQAIADQIQIPNRLKLVGTNS